MKENKNLGSMILCYFFASFLVHGECKMLFDLRVVRGRRLNEMREGIWLITLEHLITNSASFGN